MKKIIITAVVVILIAAAVVTAFLFSDRDSGKTEADSRETTVALSESDLTVDGWLKITKIFEYDGKLAVIAENISDTDVEYALLTVKTKENSFSFDASVLLHGEKVLLVCNEASGFNPEEIYTGWKTENVLDFAETPVMHDDKYEVRVTDGSISVKNISGEDISSDIYIYYKEKADGYLNGNITRRVRIAGLKAGSQTYVNATGINENNCQIMFTEYDS